MGSYQAPSCGGVKSSGKHPNGVLIQPENFKRPTRNDVPFEERIFPNTTQGNLLQGIVRSYLIKQEPRMGWARKSVCSENKLYDHPCEMVGSHQWGSSFLIMAITATKEFQEELPNFDQLRAIKMALVHDLPELVTGDIIPTDGINAELKHQKEAEAMKSILNDYPDDVGQSIGLAYKEYEDRLSSESKFVKDCDRLDFMINAFVLERQGFSGFSEFYDNTKRGDFHSNIARDLAELLTKTRNDLAEANTLFKIQK